jgi:hypothetical protein
VAIEAFTFEPDLTRAFAELPRSLRGRDPQWVAPPDREVRAQLEPTFPFYRRAGNDHRRFLATAGGTVRGRVAAFVNGDLRDHDGARVGAVGLFECANDRSVAQDLLGEAVRWLGEAHGLVRVWGPMNFDLWHGYRLLCRGFEKTRFLGEPDNPPYHPDLFEAAGFAVRRRWRSFEVVGRPALAAAWARAAARAPRLAATGYRFEPLVPGRLDDHLEDLHAAVTASFAGFLGFTPVTVPEFASILAIARYALAPGSGLLQDVGGRVAGFVLAFHDIAEAVRSMRGRSHAWSRLRFLVRRRRASRILLHSGGLVPGEAGRVRGLARAVFTQALAGAMQSGTERVLFPLVAEDNPIRGLYAPFAHDREREYALFETRAA